MLANCQIALFEKLLVDESLLATRARETLAVIVFVLELGGGHIEWYGIAAFGALGCELLRMTRLAVFARRAVFGRIG